MHETKKFRLGLSAAIVLLFCFTLIGAETERSCRIKFMVGSVQVRKGVGQTLWQGAKLNMKLSTKDAIRTFVESRAEMEMENGSVIKLEENSTMEISNLAQDEKSKSENTKMKVMSGKMWANVKKMTNSRSSFSFETPTATASIRGTELSLEVDKDGTRLKVFDGTVYIAPTGGGNGASVGANQMTFVKKGQKDVAIEKMKEEKSTTTPTTPAVDTTKKDTSKVDTTKADTSKVKADTTKKDTSKVKADTSKAKADTSKAKTDTSKVKAKTDTSKTKIDSAKVKADTSKVKKDTTKAKIDTSKTKLDGSKTKADTAKKTVPLILELFSPNDGDISSGGVIPVTGKTTSGATVRIKGKPATVSASGTFNTTVDLPNKPGDYSFTVEASLGDQTKSISRTVTVKLPLKTLSIVLNSPKDRELFSTTSIPVSGVTVPGAQVTVGGSKVMVSPTGNFSSTFFIPDESGEYSVEVEASLEGAPAPVTVTRTIIYEKRKIPLTLTVMSPAKGTEIKISRVMVQGQTTGNQVTVNGDPATVVNGQFSYNLTISENKNWDLNLITVIASNGEEERTEEIPVTISQTSPAINTSAPLLTAVLPRGNATTIAKLSISILDNTPEDEIQFTNEVDGSPSSPETYGGKDKLTFDFLEGTHKYRFFASDKAGNKSNIIVWEGALIAKRPSILLRNPASGTASLTIPNSPPGREFTPTYSIEFEVKDLPNDDVNLLKEVRIFNQSYTGTSPDKDQKLTSFIDTKFTFDVPLERRASNLIRITVIDKADNLVQKDVTILVR